ncbi:isoamylase early set domain-containing protein [Namhaeicola litoreus]|uniref:Isoamylase early set domain-containing protein n=1 Tax=Namhaeicola litoreus TaxID=1052145 RepID=A0ABW3Y201_9FLAO
MSIKKQFLKSKPVCKVSFKLTSEEAKKADKVQILGDFNKWKTSTKGMNKLKSGDFSQVIELEAGKEFQFRYLIDGEIWANEPEADGLAPNEFSSHNSIISTKQ